ncbi:condensin complex non-SMC subunit Cnd1 [Basidiobolus ranarum]|uniref:Condensin complex subunit 1 n=1 Tax=Basidiobolus ranarum TaxID=34480 RepID=A0ABR2WPI0_9FUNG
MSKFNIQDELVKLQDNSTKIENEVDVANLNPAAVETFLNDAVDKIEDDCGSITDMEVFDCFRSFIKYFNLLKPQQSNKLLDILLSGFQTQIDQTEEASSSNNPSYENHVQALMMYSFLLHWLTGVAEKKAMTKSNADKNNSKVKKNRSKREDEQESWDWMQHKQKSLELMSRTLDIKLNKICSSSHERDTCVNLLTRSAYQILENPDNLKAIPVKLQTYHIINKSVLDYEHSFAAQTTILQNLQYYEHLSEPMAELLYSLAEQFEHPQLAETILREVSNKDFHSNDKNGPKSFSRFLTKLSELSPKLLLKQMGLLVRQLDSESYVIRCALIEIIGHAILHLATLEQNDLQHKQIDHYFDVLEERFRDVNSICRSKVLQVLSILCESKAKFPKRRPRLVALVISRLEDKSSNVRKNAIKTLSKLLETHPFLIEGGELVLDTFQGRLNQIDRELKEIVIPSIEKTDSKKKSRKSTKADDEDDLGLDSSSDENSESEDNLESAPAETNESAPATISPEIATKVIQLQFHRRYYTDAVEFVESIHEAIPILCQLLGSTTKAEVMEAMDFFVTATRYKIQLAQDGIRKMLHLVWVKDNGNDETKGIRSRLIDAFRTLYLTSDPSLTHKDNVNLFSRHLIGLTFESSLAELTSLDEILSIIMSEGHIPDELVSKLWGVYGITKKEIPKAQRRGAIIILGMLAKARKEIISERIDLLLKIGLGELGKEDLALAKYTCLALQRLGEAKRGKGLVNTSNIRLPLSHAIFKKIEEFLAHDADSNEWSTVAEQAVNTVYLLCDHPDVLCSNLIKAKARRVFATESDAEKSEDQEQNSQATSLLSQLLFIVGHVAMKQIVHLEIIESAWKKRKAEAKQAAKKKPDDDELDQVVGSTEDDVADVIAHVRERELLFGGKSLLATFGPLITHICTNNTIYKDRSLQINAALALAKFMCVSGDFCEKHLQLLFTMLEKSSDAIVRSNIVIALGDVAVCFNTLVGENIAFLYKRLRDPDNSVKKNTLMVLTHLILNGMIKVKGQLGEMAKCLENSDQRISDLAKLFFTELASKDNAVYNNLPDMISSLSSGENAINEESFKRIMKFLFEFIKDKERQTENIVEKLCLRFRNTDESRQWKDIAYCLSLMQYRSDRTFKKLLDGMAYFHDKLHNDTVYHYMMEIINKARSQVWQRDKSMVDEFEAKILEVRKYAEKPDYELDDEDIAAIIGEQESESEASEDGEEDDEDSARHKQELESSEIMASA